MVRIVYQFKKRHFIEMVLIVLLVALLLSISIPRFLHNQISQQLEHLLKKLFQQVVHNPSDVLEFAKQYSRRVEFSQMHITSPHEACFWKTYTLDWPRIQQHNPQINLPNWRLSEIRLLAVTLHGFDQNEVLNDQTGQYTIPYYFALRAQFGKDLTADANHPISIQVDEQGFYQVQSHYTPYAVTNGLFSFGEIMLDSQNLRKKQRASVKQFNQVIFSSSF